MSIKTSLLGIWGQSNIHYVWRHLCSKYEIILTPIMYQDDIVWSMGPFLHWSCIKTSLLDAPKVKNGKWKAYEGRKKKYSNLETAINVNGLRIHRRTMHHKHADSQLLSEETREVNWDLYWMKDWVVTCTICMNRLRSRTCIPNFPVLINACIRSVDSFK